MMKNLNHLLLAAVIALAAGAAPSVRAETYGNADALRGLKSGKGLFLVDLDDGRKVAMYLKLIAGSGESLRRQGITTDFKVVFIGPSVKFLVTEPPAQATTEERAVFAEIARAAHVLKAQGVALEVCAIATNVFKIDNAGLLPEVTVVADGFISLIGYQAQGFHLVPIF